jgi:hypothetical protein
VLACAIDDARELISNRTHCRCVTAAQAISARA